MQPVILLTFSNNDDAYLAKIVEEQKAIKNALLDYADKNYIQIRDLQRVSTQEVFYLINRYNQRVAILHYAGHADAESLQLEQEIGVVQTANVKGIAGLLGTQKHLKLVFLNGCASRGQVKALLDQGVPAVIATRVKINDKEAQLFGTQFYEAMSSGSSIGEAYQKAKALIETQRKDQPILFAKSQTVVINPNKKEEIPWGLYCKEGGEAVLDWKLPTESPIEFNISGGSVAGKQDSVINRHLVQPTLKAIADGKYVKELVRKLNKEIASGRAKRAPTDAEMKDVIVRSFPAPISVHLRTLFSRELSEKFDEVRLRQLWTTYREAVKLFAFILFSDLWNTRFKQSAPLDLLKEERWQVKAFFELNEFTAADFDYFLLVEALLKLVNVNKTKCYMNELSQFPNGWAGNDNLYRANEHFQLMRSVLEDDVPSRLIETYCILSEQHLANVLKEWKFLINYKMAVIKNIEVQSIRNTPPAIFKHAIVELDNNYNDIGHKDRWENLEEPTNMESVILYRDLVNDNLNLSPFVLDENALTREYNSKVFFFSHSSENGLHYDWIENPRDKLLISDEQYGYVKKQFEKARLDILNEKQLEATTSEFAEDDDITSFL